MIKIHTHYDNLKVARTAPFEVIRSAYKALSQKYHPDKNPGNPDAIRIMSIINQSYEILSDPDKRRQHDIWIEQQEQNIENRESIYNQSIYNNSESISHTNILNYERIKIFLNHIKNYWLLYGIIIFVIWALIDNSNTPTPSPIPYSRDPIYSTQNPITSQDKLIFAKPEYTRPLNAPNGTPWPQKSSYVRGYEILNNDGLSKVTIDNSQNNSDVFVKLVSLDGPKAYPVRNFFILAYGKFTLNNVTAGKYDIRYRDLNSGHLARSESFDIEEISTYDGVNYSNITMTLYKVLDGNMETYDLAESEF